jgi:cysteamine dioxygenase
MAAIQKLYEVCKVSLSEKGPSSLEAVENVRDVLDMITPSDVGLESEAQAVRVWRRPRALNRKTVFPSSPAIRYRHIYECKSFSIGIFCMPASSIIPLHNHPGMTVLSKLLYGKVHVKSYDWIDIDDSRNLSKVRPAKVVRDGEISAPCGAMVLGNIHAMKAITPCAILDILSPPYSSEDGRHCSYFRRLPKSDPSGILLDRTRESEFVWLEEYQPSDNFVIRRDLYTGPTLNF